VKYADTLSMHSINTATVASNTFFKFITFTTLFSDINKKSLSQSDFVCRKKYFKAERFFCFFKINVSIKYVIIQAASL